ncbi:hypothetical protein QA597_08370 [Marinilabiliaceae bacterium ANBcel2]|nr:hypothetical protein [Marinilabiliaceae bacterium ANBcel2]
MIRIKNISLIIITLILVGVNTYGQIGYRGGPFNITDGMTITPRAGVNFFYGSLADEQNMGYSVGVTIDREMSRILSARLNIISGTMQGTQIFEGSNRPYANFDNFYTEITIGGTYRPLNHIFGYFKERGVQPYALLQTGFIYFDATEYWGPIGDGPDGSEWRTATGVAGLASAGGGASFWVTPSLSANLEITGTYAFSDQIDAHDVWYARYDENMQGIGEANTTNNDFYYQVTAGVSYLISPSLFRNDSRFNRRSYNKTRRFFQPRSGRSSRRFLFF